MTPERIAVRERRRIAPKFRGTSVHDLIYQHQLTERLFAWSIGYRRLAVVSWMEGTEPPFTAVCMMARVFGKPLEFFVQPPKVFTCSPPPATE